MARMHAIGYAVDGLSEPSVSRIGRYEIVGLLATGGMAEILLARLVGPSGFERPVVVKRILPHLARLNEFVNMFVDEARIVAGIRHPNVVQVQELAREQDNLFLVMEYLEGESVGGLARRLTVRRESIDRTLAAFVIAEACAGLHAAHELTDEEGLPRDVVHRDVSPQNVFVTYAGQIKLLDFGIAKAANRSTRTEAGHVKGKFAYMSPEQCLGKPLDRRSDLFALGIVLWELSSGRRLFERGSNHLTFKAICEERIPAPSEFSPDYPRELERIVMKALSRRRNDRPANALELRRELLAWARGAGLSETPEEDLAQMMRRLFAERIEEKQEMLRRFSVGSAPKQIPVAEPDEHVELPSIVEDLSTIHTAADVRSPERRRSARLPAIAIAAVLLAGGGAAVVTRQLRTSDPPVAAVAPPSSASAPPRTNASAVPRASESAKVTVRIETTPPLARVIVDGRDRGPTPLELELDRSDTPLMVELRRAGFITRKERVTPSVSQRLVLPLTAPPAAKPTKPKEVPRFR